MSRIKDFIDVYLLYAKHHKPAYALRMAWGIAIKGLPF